MEEKKINAAWARSLFVVGITTVILLGAKILGLEMADNVVRVLGILDLAALFALALTTVRKLSQRE